MRESTGQRAGGWRGVPPGSAARLGAGAGCLAAALLLGLAVGHRVTWLDRAVPSAARRLVPPESRLVEVLSSEVGWPPGSSLMALAPLLVAAGFLAVEVRRLGGREVVRRWWWLLLTAVAVPVHYALRVLFGRPGPGEEVPEGALWVGAYPSGAALAMGLGWTAGTLVVGAHRPRWRPLLLAATAAALLLHLAVRTVTGKHWATDIVGSYLLVAGVFLLAGRARG